MSAPVSRPRRVLTALLLGLGGLVSVALALLVVGLLVPALPVLGVAGGVALGARTFPAAVLGGLVVVVAVVCRLRRARRVAAWAAVTGVITLAGSLVALGTQLAFAHDQHARVSFADLIGGGQPAAPADRTVTYATVGGVVLRAGIWLPGGRVPASPRPAVVWVHGGGFTASNRDEQRGLYRDLANRGWPVVSIDYRLAPPPRWHDATGDVVCALSWLTSHGASYGIDPRRLVLSGGSAGGSLVLNAAYGLAGHALTPSCPGPAPAVPVGVAGFYPAADLAGIWADDGYFGYARDAGRAYLGGSPSAYPDRYAYASATTRIRPGLMPTLLVTGANDHLVRPARVREVRDRLRAAGDPVTYLTVPYSEHGFDYDHHSIGEAISRAALLSFLARVAPLR